MMRKAHLWKAVASFVWMATVAVGDETLDRAAAMDKIQQLGGRFLYARPVGMSMSLEPVPTAVIPYWAIVIPLTLLAAWLLLSQPKPRLIPVKRHSHSS